MFMECPIETPDHVERLVAYSAGRLDSAARSQVEAHLWDCAGCRELVAAQKKVWDALDRWEADPVSAGFDRRLYRRIQERISWWDYLARPLRPLLVRRGIPIAAAAALVIVAGLLSQPPPGLPPAPPPKLSELDAASPDQVERALDDMEMLRELNRLVRAEMPEPKM